MARYVGFKISKVHESHTVSDYYCGRCGYPVTDHDSYCPECGGAFRECDVDCLEDEIGNLKAENEKLRDLVRDTWEIASYSQCTPCKFFDTCDGCPCILRERIHELEIEV